jgi:signal transduction histidine kinase
MAGMVQIVLAIAAWIILGGATCVGVRALMGPSAPGGRRRPADRRMLGRGSAFPDRATAAGRLRRAWAEIGWGMALIPVAVAYLTAFGSYLMTNQMAYGNLFGLFGAATQGDAIRWTFLTVMAVGAATAAAPRRAGYLAAIAASALGLYLLCLDFFVQPYTYKDLWYGWIRDHVDSPALAFLGVAALASGFVLTRRTIVASIRARETILTARVEQLTETRADAVGSAAAELRRVERDLHDGAQARLVALGINLRTAEKLVKSSPDEAVALVADCRDTATLALAELRDLVRGIYPPVLADRGLGDAVRALALDCPVPASTDIQLSGRPPAPVESAVYFAVAEALSNAAKHAQARSVFVRVAHDGRLLRAEVHDDGTGGVDPASGTGLAGIERRLAAFDGILAVSSPAGGPTIIVIEVPCDLSSLKTSTS